MLASLVPDLPGMCSSWLAYFKQHGHVKKLTCSEIKFERNNFLL